MINRVINIAGKKVINRFEKTKIPGSYKLLESLNRQIILYYVNLCKYCENINQLAL